MNEQLQGIIKILAEIAIERCFSEQFEKVISLADSSSAPFGEKPQSKDKNNE